MTLEARTEMPLGVAVSTRPISSTIPVNIPDPPSAVADYARVAPEAGDAQLLQPEGVGQALDAQASDGGGSTVTAYDYGGDEGDHLVY